VSLLTILFTANLHANFERLPYLATTLRQARWQDPAEDPRPTLIVDLGGAWAAESSICQITENRAPYLILDAMGYTVARADGLDVGGILGMREVVQMFMMDDSIVFPWRSYGITVQVGPKGNAPCITWALPAQTSPDPTTFYEAETGRITLYPPDGFVGKIVAEYPNLAIVSAERIPIDTKRPDPSIIEMVKFVEWEARAYHERQNQKGDSST
jgi:hypothetical protein